MAKASKNVVPSIVYLPEHLDDVLRAEAAASNWTLNELLLHYVKLGVEAVGKRETKKKDKR